jgi:hypothetical protein
MAAKVKEDKEDTVSAIERGIRKALEPKKSTAGTMTGGLGKMISSGLDAAGTVIGTPMKVVGSAVRSAVGGGEGAAGALRNQAKEFARSTKSAREGADEAIGNLKDDLAARAQGAVTTGVGAARALKGAADTAGTIIMAPARVAGGAIGSAIMGGDGAVGSLRGVAEDLGESLGEVRRGTAGMNKGAGEVLAGEKEDEGQKSIASMDMYDDSFVGPQKPRPSIDPNQDLGGARTAAERKIDDAFDTKSAATSSEDRMAALFKKANAGDFDPKSRVDREKMAQLKAVMDSNPELANASDSKVALAWYKTLEKKKR